MIDSPPPSPPPVPYPFVPACLATGLWDAQNAVCYDPTHNHRHQRPRPDNRMRPSTENRRSRSPGPPPYPPARDHPNDQARRHPMDIPPPPDRRQRDRDDDAYLADILDDLRAREYARHGLYDEQEIRRSMDIPPPPPDRRQQDRGDDAYLADLLDALREREYAGHGRYNEQADTRRPRSPLIDIFGNDENHPMYNPHAGNRPRGPSRDPRVPYDQAQHSDVPPRPQMRPGVDESRETRGQPDHNSSRSRPNPRPVSPPPVPYRSGQGAPRGDSGRTQRRGPDQSAESQQRSGPRRSRYSDWDNNNPTDRGRAQPSRGANAAQQQGPPAPSRPPTGTSEPREREDLFEHFFPRGAQRRR